ncbi:exodeoxyribonuclease VII large subunit [Globicatella sanguinis]|uniref:exodeoxyribonuclease VII large subunit n=1 Tax=Globicatella sanguinis TaxID=13076 RepID=UPI0008258D62|nr:exodeoxyribonuclease VII large subunit [Globicatella sanguinis]
MNEKYLTVKALTQYLKRKFDVDPHLQRVFVVGEVSNFRMRPNAHQYFSLKDDGAVINAVMFKHAFNKLPFKLEEGMKVLAVGRVGLYEKSGQYQITIENLQPDGVGALYQALEQLKEKFRKEGLFDVLNRPIEKFPKKIAVITSPSGAVIRDILTTIKRRYPIVQVTVFPTRVQGQEAAGEIAAAFDKVKNLASEFDTVILARGGGSIEDLWPFNEEVVAKAILDCPIPVISSIGHETDTTIADLVADLRAPTPTAAAEMSVPVMTDILAYLNGQSERLIYAINAQFKQKQKRLSNVQQSYILTQPERLYQAYTQQLDNLITALWQHQQKYLQKQRHQVELTSQKLGSASPANRINQQSQLVERMTERMAYSMQLLLNKKEHQFKQGVVQLEAYSPLNILARGYSVVSKDGNVVKSVASLEQQDDVEIRLLDGKINATVNSIEQIKGDK